MKFQIKYKKNLKKLRFKTKMEKLTSEISGMLTELMTKEEDGKKITVLTPNLSNIYYSGINEVKSFDFASICDNFRQHIHNRRNTDSSELVLLDENLLQYLKSLKEEMIRLLQEIKNVSESTSPDKSSEKVKKFSSFEEFISFIVNQKGTLNSEIWKLEAISNYLTELEQFSPLPPSVDMKTSQGH